MSLQGRGFITTQLETDSYCDSIQYPSVPCIDSGLGLESVPTLSGNLISEQMLAENLNNVLRLASHPQQSASLVPSEQVSTPEFITYYQQNEDGDTLLHLSIIKNNKELAIKLIHAAEDSYYLNIQNYHYNHTPLHLAVIMGQPEVLRALVVRGACLMKQDHKGNTPVHLACHLGKLDCLRQLTTPLSVQESQALQKINCPRQDHAFRSNDFTMKNYEGETCLHVTLGSLTQTVQSRMNIIMYLLVSLAMDVNLQEGKCGYTILQQAIKMNEVDIVKFLLYQPSIDVNRSCYNGSTPLSLAKSQHQQDIVNQLLNIGAIDNKCDDFDCSSDSDEDPVDGFDDLMI